MQFAGKPLMKGDVVVHPQFGQGRVLEARPGTHGQTVDIDFGRAGVKTIATHSARLQVISRVAPGGGGQPRPAPPRKRPKPRPDSCPKPVVVDESTFVTLRSPAGE